MKQLTLTIDEKTLEALDAKGKRESRNRSNCVRVALHEYFAIKPNVRIAKKKARAAK